MRHLRVFVHRLSGLFRKDRREREFAEEIESNLQMNIADNLRLGMSAGEARRQALIQLGGVEATKEAYRDQRGFPLFETLVSDVRYGVRGLRRSPAFALTAVLTLALGIGATTAIFSAVYALLIRPLPYHDPSRLVWVTERPRSGVVGFGAIATPDMIAWRERGRPFESAAAFGFNEFTLTGIGEALRLPGAMVSANFFSLLGVRPQIGRDFIPADGHRGSPEVALLSDALWRERFSVDPRVVGTALDLDGKVYTVVGVLPAGFRFPDMAHAPQVLTALQIPGSSTPGINEPIMFLHVLARLHPGDSLASVQADLEAFQRSRRQVYPAPLARMFEGNALEVTPLQRHLAGDSRTPLLILLAAVGFVLLIACANVANLQLVRAAARRQEIAVRGALGAARTRLIRQFFTESMVICALAATAGLGIGALAIKAIRGWHSPALPWLDSVSLDPQVLAVSTAVAILAAALLGAAPAITGSRANVIEALKATPLGISGPRERRMLRNAFVVGEVALALVLLIAAGLLVRSFRNLIRIDPGYNPHNVLTASVQLPDGTSNLPFAAEALPKLQALAGVRYAALTNLVPLQPNGRYSLTMVWSGPVTPPREMLGALRVPLVSATPDSFQAMGTPIVEGRVFHEDDNGRSPGVAIVNGAFVRKFCPGGALGKRFHSLAREHCAGCPADGPAELEVVGIAADVHQGDLDKPAGPEIYVPFAQAPRDNFDIVLATSGNPGALAASLRSIVFALDRRVPVYDIATLDDRLSESLAPKRLTLFLLSAFAALALLLAAIGVYGVISYAVVQRTREIGIRVALGATDGSVLRLVLLEQARLVLMGGAVGLALAIALSGVMSGMLYGVKPRDFTTFAVSWVMLTTAAMLASTAPALRAMRTDPSITLRYE